MLHLLAIGFGIAGSRCYCRRALPGHDEAKQGERACSTSCRSCLAISDYDGEITDFAVGVKNLETAEPATTDTIYQCGSMTKAWTALAFMQLVDEGKVGLDEPVQTYLPGFKVADPEVSTKVTPVIF